MSKYAHSTSPSCMKVERRESDCHSVALAAPGYATPSTASYSSLAGGHLSSFNSPSDALSSPRDDVGPVIEQEYPSADADKSLERHNLFHAVSNWFFSTCCGSLQESEIVRSDASSRAKYDFYQLEQLGTLGRGSFGSVALVKCHVTEQILALKGLSKGMIVTRKLQHKVKNEKLVLQQICSPFVVKLVACFNKEDHLYFLMEAATGGNLRTLYKNREIVGSEVHARFFFACIVRALEHLHERCIIYRDLKFENVVLDANGYAKLCDFGLAKFLKSSNAEGHVGLLLAGRAYTVCGTPEYIAPEVLNGLGYKFGADWWSLGVLVHEMITGKTPFRARTINGIFLKVRAGIEVARLPDDADWSSLVRLLCKHSPGERLPLLKGGVEALQALPWCSKAAFDWELHSERKMTAPHVPTHRWVCEKGNVRQPHKGRKRNTLYQDPGDGWDFDFEHVFGSLGGDESSTPAVHGAFDL